MANSYIIPAINYGAILKYIITSGAEARYVEFIHNPRNKLRGYNKKHNNIRGR